MRRDKQLVGRIKQGDKDALRILYVEYKDFLLTLANALLHDSALAEDVLHDVFVTFTRNIAAFELTGSLKAYLATCIANGAKSLLRQKKIHAKPMELATEPQAKEEACPIEAKEAAEQIRLHLASLPDEQREVVVLRAKAGLKFKDIAKLQQTTVPTVQGRYRYGIDKLRVLLNGELEK